MIDTMTNKPLRVSPDDTAGPNITLPLSQLDEVRRLLDSHHVRYWVSEHAISLDGEPGVIDIDLGHGGDAAAVQAILDNFDESENQVPRYKTGGKPMIDTMTKQPLRVSTVSKEWPYIRLPFSQLDEVRRLLDSHHVRYTVREHAISIDGGPEVIVIYLGRGGDAAAVQAILDNGG